MCITVLYYYKKIKYEINCIMKIKRPFMKVVSLNETIKHPSFKPKFDMGIFFIHFRFSISILFNKHNLP